MIFVTLGSQKFQFDRLLEAIDTLIGEGVISEEVFAQTGASTYIPKHYGYEPFLDREAFAQKMAQAEIVITHGGTGAIIGAVKQGKKVIAVPRLAKYGEHVDDHQLQLTAQFREQNLIFALEDCSQLADALKRIRSHSFRSYQSNTQTIIEDIQAYLESLL